MSEGVIDGYYRMVAAYRVTGYPLVASATKTTAAILAHWEKTAEYIAGAAAFIIAMIAAFAFLFIRLFGNYRALEEARSERKRAEQLREQSLRFDVALNNMSQGLVMFDASSKPGRQQYAVSPDLLSLARRREAGAAAARSSQAPQGTSGSFGGDPDEYYAKLLHADRKA